jgi:hypothetical protein
MRLGLHIAAPVALGLSLFGLSPGAAAQAPPPGPRELYRALNSLRVVSNQVYYVRNLYIRRDAVRFTLGEGKLAFLAAYNGRLTGAVFTGRGHVLALPRDPIEKRSLAHVLGAPLLDQRFSSAYLRFTDSTGEDLLQQLRAAGAQAAEEASFAEGWAETVANLNPWHSLRILTDWLSTDPRPYFYAGLIGEVSGAFDVLVDERRAEQVLLGQPRWVAGERFYDVWASFRRTDAPGTAASFAPVRYEIETSILQDRTLEGTATLMLKALRSGERVIPLELSRFLTVQSVEDPEHRPLDFFQNEAVNRHEIAQRGNDTLLVVVPSASRAGEEIRLRIAYRGSVISDAGNGVYFVGERGSWYPHVGGTDQFASFELTFRWPRRLQLVATGKKIEEREAGETRIGRWRPETPIAVAGFNLGEYATETVDAGDVKIELYANRQLEQTILQRFQRLPQLPPVPRTATDTRRVPPPQVFAPEAPPSPAAVLRQLGLEIADATRFFERFNGPFPYDRLAVSQIPGTFGQGWPGLLYLSTLSFLSPSAQRRVGLSERGQEQFSEIVPYHEVAHQWWGNLVAWSSYHDQWIHEGLANYIALLFADTRKTPGHTLAAWLDRYRKALTSKPSGQSEPAEEAGPLVLGYRLRSSKAPLGFDRVIYSKGTWVFHMLHGMLRDPAAKNPDARFAQLLRAVLERYRYRGLTTEDLQHAVEEVMTPAMDLEGNHSMDWFFDQWVRSTEIPHYVVEFTARPQGNNFLIRGKLKQSGVPENFLAAVPLYAASPGGKPVLLGTVTPTGEETPFRFLSRVHPKRLLIDPQMTLLCSTE